MAEFMSFDDLPESIRSQLTQHIDRAEMSMSDAMHSMYRAIDELDDEQMRTVKTILLAVCQAENPASIAMYWVGRLESLLERKCDICPACGTSHAEELLGGES